jgi:hypothetical protein
MSRALFLGTLLFAGLFLNMSWAQNKTEPTQTRPPFPFSKTTFQWEYSCPGGVACSFSCPGGETTQVIKLSLYLGTVSFDGSQNAPPCSTNSTREDFPTRAASA